MNEWSSRVRWQVIKKLKRTLTGDVVAQDPGRDDIATAREQTLQVRLSHVFR